MWNEEDFETKFPPRSHEVSMFTREELSGSSSNCSVHITANAQPVGLGLQAPIDQMTQQVTPKRTPVY